MYHQCSEQQFGHSVKWDTEETVSIHFSVRSDKFRITQKVSKTCRLKIIIISDLTRDYE